MKTVEDFLMHYGVPKRSGRYPWGSGKEPYQATGGKRNGSRNESPKPQKPVEKMTNKELKRKTNRLELETKYYKAKSELSRVVPKTPKERAKAYLKSMAARQGAKIGEQVAYYSMGKLVNKLVGDEVVKGLGGDGKGGSKDAKVGQQIIDNVIGNNKPNTKPNPKPKPDEDKEEDDN